MRVVAGLGNPGSGYRKTRHNAGFRVIDLLAARAGACRPEHEQPRGVLDRARQLLDRLVGRVLAEGAHAGRDAAGTWLAEATVGGEPVLLVKPLGFMNRSGVPIARLLAARGACASDLVVIVDDTALALGTVRVRPRGRHGGHNGLRSVIAELGTEEFVRVRIGVRRGELSGDLADYVLAEVPEDEAPAFDETLARGADAVECVLREGLAVAMGRFNGRRA